MGWKWYDSQITKIKYMTTTTPRFWLEKKRFRIVNRQNRGRTCYEILILRSNGSNAREI